MTRANLSISLLLLLLTALAGGQASAQVPATGARDADTSAAGKRADDLVRRGIALGMKDRWTEAEPLLREAWGLKHSYDIAGNLGIAEAALGKHRDAAEHLTFALRTFPTNGKPEHRLLLEQTLAKSRLQVAAVTIRVSVDKADVFVDGKVVGTAPLEDVVFVDPGPRTIEAKLTGYDPASQLIEARKGTSSELTLTLKAPAPPPTATGAVEPPPPWRPGTAWAVAGGVVAAAGLGTGLGLTFAGKSKASDANAQLATLQMKGGANPCNVRALATDCATLKSANQSADRLSNAAAAGYAVVGVGGALVLTYLLWPSKKAEPRTGTQVVPLIGSGAGGVVLTGSF
jgi:hypothetical protein